MMYAIGITGLLICLFAVCAVEFIEMIKEANEEWHN